MCMPMYLNVCARSFTYLMHVPATPPHRPVRRSVPVAAAGSRVRHTHTPALPPPSTSVPHPSYVARAREHPRVCACACVYVRVRVCVERDGFRAGVMGGDGVVGRCSRASTARPGRYSTRPLRRGANGAREVVRDAHSHLAHVHSHARTHTHTHTHTFARTPHTPHTPILHHSHTRLP